MPSAEIITIGTELLLGEIVDTNTQFIAVALREAGIDLFRTVTVGDNVERIAQAIRESLERSDIVITTGGLGPTVDDPTREAVSLAVGVKPVFRPELWEQIKNRFQRLGRIPTDNNMRQAYIPEGSIGIENPVGTAPIFIVESSSHNIVSLPGVPSEMKYLLQQSIIPYLRKYYDLNSVIKARTLHTVGIGESQIDDLIGHLEKLDNPSVGLAAHSGQVDVRITVKAASLSEADQMIHPVEVDLRQRLGEWIYGTDDDTLEGIALQPLLARHWTLVVVESGLGGNLIRRLASAGSLMTSGQWISTPIDLDLLADQTNSYRHSQGADVGLGVALQLVGDTYNMHQVLITPHRTEKITRRYGGVPEYAPVWAFNQSMDMIRRIANDN